MTGLDQLPLSDPTSILRYRDGIYAVDLLTAAITEFRLFDYLKDLSLIHISEPTRPY